MNNKYDFKKIAKKIKETRKEHKISQEKISEECHVSRATVIKWEKGGQLPDLNSMLIMCNLFDCELGYLLCEKGYENKTREVTDICKATGLSENAVNNLMYDTSFREDYPILKYAYSKRVKLINLLLDEGIGLTNSIWDYKSFEFRRLELSKNFDLKLFSIDKPNLNKFDSFKAIDIAILLIQRKIPIINNLKSKNNSIGSLDFLYSSDGAKIFEDMMSLVDTILDTYEIDEEEDFFIYVKMLKDYNFTEEEKLTLYYLFDYQDVLNDITGKLHKFIVMQEFEDFLSKDVSDFLGGVSE